MRALTHLHDYATRYPGAWRAFEAMRAARGAELPDWPDWCYLPLSGAYAVVSDGGDAPPLARMADVAALGALGAWRMTKGIYRYDPDIQGALWGTPVTGELPGELLLRLPEWCVYIELAGREVLGERVHGFFAHLESDANDGRRELRLLLDTDAGLWPLPVHLGGTLEAGLAAVWSEAAVQAARHAARGFDLPARLIGDAADRAAGLERDLPGAIAPLVSLVLYLCSERPDIRGAGVPGNPAPKRVKGGERVFAAPGVRTWDVAVRLGEAYRRANREVTPSEGTGTRAAPRPHVRAAHWHTYRTGKGRAERTLRWLAPVAVGVRDPDAVPVVVRRVRGGQN